MTLELRGLLELFYDEATEHLTDIDAALRKLDASRPDPEGLESMFRAARSATASAITLGLADVTELACQFERVLDRLRHEHLGVTQELRDAGLHASAVLKALLAAHRGTGTVDSACAERACRRLQALDGRRDTGAMAPASRLPSLSEGAAALLPSGVLPVGWRGQGRRTASAPDGGSRSNEAAAIVRAGGRGPVVRWAGTADGPSLAARRKP